MPQKCQKEAEAKSDGVINPQIYNFYQYLLRGKFWCSKNATNQPRSTVEICYMCPRGLSSPTALTLTK